MAGKCTRPVLIVEGAGDVQAIPILIRNILSDHQIFDVQISSKTKQKVDIPKLRRAGGLERYLKYASYEDVDSILLLLDCDDDCPKEIAAEFVGRAQQLCQNREIRGDQKFGFCFFNSEFEALFLYCLPEIAETYRKYSWDLSAYDAGINFETIRDAKGQISGFMGKGRAYKPATDQASFVQALDFEKLRGTSRSFLHLERLLLWLVGERHPEERFYPVI